MKQTSLLLPLVAVWVLIGGRGRRADPKPMPADAKVYIIWPADRTK